MKANWKIEDVPVVENMAAIVFIVPIAVLQIPLNWMMSLSL